MWIQNYFVAPPVVCTTCFCDWFTFLIMATNLWFEVDLDIFWYPWTQHVNLGGWSYSSCISTKKKTCRLIPIPKCMFRSIFPQVQGSWLLAMLQISSAACRQPCAVAESIHIWEYLGYIYLVKWNNSLAWIRDTWGLFILLTRISIEVVVRSL